MKVFTASSDLSGNSYRLFMPPVKLFINEELALRSLPDLKAGMYVRLYAYEVTAKNYNLIALPNSAIREYCMFTIPITLYGRLLYVESIESVIITKEVIHGNNIRGNDRQG